MSALALEVKRTLRAMEAKRTLKAIMRGEALVREWLDRRLKEKPTPPKPTPQHENLYFIALQRYKAKVARRDQR